MSQNDTLKEELAKIDARIADLKAQEKLGSDLQDLHNDEKFINVLLEGYFEKEAERVFELLVTPTTLKRDQIENVEDKLSAIRNFKLYFKTLLINAQMAPEQIEDEEAYRLKILKQMGETVIDAEIIEDK